MTICIGSANATKINAVKEVVIAYENVFGNIDTFKGISVPSGVSDQPKSIDEIILGAKNRAKKSFDYGMRQCSYSFGIESGIFTAQHVATEIMNICACAIYDGTNYFIGLSPAFEYPKTIVDQLIKYDECVNDAFKNVGLTTKDDLGKNEGAIGFLTKNRMTRTMYTKLAVQMAVIGLENKELYE